MEFRSLSDMGRAVINWSERLPIEPDLIVGIPRSGMLAATMLALHLHKPLVDFEGYLAGRSFQGGDRTGQAHAKTGHPRKVLIIDDSVGSGAAIGRAKSAIPADVEDCLTWGAVYSSLRGQELVDTFGEFVSLPRIFEWNMFHHALLAVSCMDIDGVLCRDPSDIENDDGPRYRHFIESVPARVIPGTKVGHLVSARTEAYRSDTETWLATHNIEFGELHLYQGTTAERRSRGDHALHKARVYREVGAQLFIESDVAQAAEISRISGRAVIATDEMRFFEGGALYQAVSRTRDPERLADRALRKLMHLGGRFRL